MRRLSRPWGREALSRPFAPADCLLTEADDGAAVPGAHSLLMRAGGRRLLLHPYPRSASGEDPPRRGFPVRPRRGQDPQGEAEERGAEALRRMNEVLARVQELEEALDDPARTWPRLRAAWDRARDEANPRMAEIVRQARDLGRPLERLEPRLRRVLRRARETVPVARVQEVDRASMLALARRPGRTTAERAGPEQRILGIVRRENFDTPENRVLRSYCELAASVARGWLREHPYAQGGRRWAMVEAHRKRCALLERTLADKGVARAAPGMQPNYVLSQDPDYRAIHKAWVLLLQMARREDDLWAWQAQTWTDFCVLACVLSLEALDEAELVAQSPIIWRDEAVHGRFFAPGAPLATFWLRETGRIVEVRARPEGVGPRRAVARAQALMTVHTPGARDFPRHIAIWTPHAMERINPAAAAEQARDTLEELQRVPSDEILRDGLILTPAHGPFARKARQGPRTRIEAIALGASGAALGDGLSALGAYLRSDIWGAGA
ncbi:hypothetical protein ACQ5SO_10505 [Rhodovulum sp. DZ06]|uniref:hypothetical protein n=1 Tax=Rhodovulum sp. DZ06 TaxID=3425126 RepID=UPI003D358062